MRFPLVSEGELLSSPPPELPRQLVRKYKLEKSRKGTGIGQTLRKDVACPLGRLPWGGTLDEVLRRFFPDSFH